MVLYHTATMYQLLCCIVHKLTYHNNEDTVLLMSEQITPIKKHDMFLERLNKFEFFTKCQYIPEQKIDFQKGMALNEDSSEKEINEVINNICTAFENWFEEDIGNYNKFYIASDQHSCGIYLAKNNIPYTYIEDASGMLSEQARFLAITKRLNLTDHIINDYLGLAGRNKNVIAKLCDLKYQQYGFFDEKAQNFSIYETLKEKIPEQISVLLNFFDVPNIRIASDKKIRLFLTQDLNTLKEKDIDLQELVTTKLADYVFPDYELVVKPHPKDRWQNYKRIFPNVTLIPRDFPSELLPFAIDNDISVAYTASSTSIRGVTDFVQKAYYFTSEVYAEHQKIDDIYIVSQILKRLGITSGVNIQNTSSESREQLMNFLDGECISTGENDVLIDGGQVKNDKFEFTGDQLTLCMNLGNVLNFPYKWDIENTVLIQAYFIPKSGSLLEEKKVLIFAKANDEICQKLEKMSFSKKMQHTKAYIEVICAKLDNETREKLYVRRLHDIKWEDDLSYE